MKPLELVVDATIRAPLGDVWSYVVEGYFDHHASWDPAIRKMENLTGGPIGVGTRGRETRRVLGDVVAEFEVTACEHGRRFALRNVSGPLGLEREYAFREEAGATLLTFRFTAAPKGAMHLLFPLLRRSIPAQVRANVARIPTLLEARLATAHG